jgi:hypothetical protein
MTDEGGDPPCWAHLLEEDDATVVDGSAQLEPPDERAGDGGEGDHSSISRRP